MRYYNISNPSEKVTLKQAVLKSISQKSDLYMPEYVPHLTPAFFQGLKKMNFNEIAFNVSKSMLRGDIPESVLENIVSEAFPFPIPLKKLSETLFVLELFHGPTLAFKDVGARFMAGLFEYLIRNDNQEITILVATSGDTGSAVANAYFGRKGISVVILYPTGKVSDIQEKQLTTMGGNITTLEIDGDFDDCQSLVKSAFADTELNKQLNLTSANSINFARLFPQSFYYFFALAQLPSIKKPVTVSVPCGNFGNLTAGLIAKKMGLGIHNFIASTNSNHAVVDYLACGLFKPGRTEHTISNAMDVGNPSNFPRILEMFNNQHDEMSSAIKGFWFTDTETGTAMKVLQSKYGYQADPHGAIAYAGLKKYQERNDCIGIFLETAHPAKFSTEVESATKCEVQIPEGIKKLLTLEKRSVRMSKNYSGFRDFLLQSV